VTIKFSDRPEQRIGDDAVWDKSESALMAALKASGRPWTLNKGEGAFYGPKLEYVLRDAIGRDWQCGTVQVDLNMPGRLGAFYIDPYWHLDQSAYVSYFKHDAVNTQPFDCYFDEDDKHRTRANVHPGRSSP
jgi:threonyl-tRNA synthetase